MGSKGLSNFKCFLFSLLLMVVTLSSYPKSQAVMGNNQKILVICVKYTNHSTTRLAKASDWVALLKKETNPFYNHTTYGKTTFSFETPSSTPNNGWLKLGYDNTKYNFRKVGQDAISLIDPHVDFSNYNRVLVITNWKKFGGEGCAPAWWKVKDGVEQKFSSGGKIDGYRKMSLAIVNEMNAHDWGNSFDEAAAVMAHEIGHQLDAKTHYHDFRWHPGFNRDSITPWGLMGLSPELNHYIGWAKADLGWIPDWPNGGSRIRMVGPPTSGDIDTTITLIPVEETGSGVQLIGIPLTALKGSNPRFYGYVLENRQKMKGDQYLPNEGVLISLVDESPNVYLGRKCIVMPDPDNPKSSNEAIREVGDVFTDPSQNLTIKVLSQSGKNYKVRIQYKKPPVKKADPMITPWNQPPWETKDIWIDSEKNGWGTYRYTDKSGHPVGNGDNAWVNKINRVYIRVHNLGEGDATNVRARLFANEPPGMGAGGSKWAYLGTIVFPTIPAKGSAQNYLKWKPRLGKHTCLKAKIEDLPNELSTTNNVAQENVSHFETSAKSPYEPVELTMSVSNPFKKDETPVWFNIRNIPKGWIVELDEWEILLPPGGDDMIRMKVYPSGTPTDPIPDGLQDMYPPGFIGKPGIEAWVPYADTFIPIGGVDFHVHQVIRTHLDISCDPSGSHVNLSGTIQPPISAAKIALVFKSNNQEEVKFTTTNSGGQYHGQFPIPGAGVWQVQAFYAGNKIYRSTQSHPCNLNFQETPQPGDDPKPDRKKGLTLQIVNKNPDGILTPLEETPFIVIQHDRPVFEGKADAEGMIIIPLNEGPYRVEVNPDREPTAILEVMVEKERDLFIIHRHGQEGEMFARPTIRHQIILGEEESPIFRIKEPEPAEHHEPHRPQEPIHTPSLERPEKKTRINFQMIEKIGDHNQRPVPGPFITIVRNGERFAWGQTNEEGKFSFNLPQGTYELHVQHDGFHPYREELHLMKPEEDRIIHLQRQSQEDSPSHNTAPGISQKIPVHLIILEKLRGVINQPVADAWVEISMGKKVLFSRSPDPQGNVRTHLDPGRYRVTITSENHKPKKFKLKVKKRAIKKKIYLKH